MKLLNRQDLTDILYGCAILGTGGGGELDEGFNFIEMAIAEGKEFRLVGVDEVPEGSHVCTPYMLGAVSASPAEEDQKYKRLPRSEIPPIMLAFQRLEEYTGEKYYGTICCELGGSNTAISFYVAAMADGYIIDADPAGRAVPEITHSTYYFNGLPAAPIVAANEFGECFIIENIIDDARAEDIVRALAIVSRNDIASIDHSLSIEQVKQSIIKGTVSEALELGRTFREAKAAGLDVADEIAIGGKGFVAFRGRVVAYECHVEKGFTVGYVEIQGVGANEEDHYKFIIKNENMAGWKNGELQVTIPDLICLIDMDAQEPVTNPNHRIGMHVAVVVLPAREEFTCKKALAAFGPAYIGINSEYVPAVKMYKERN